MNSLRMFLMALLSMAAIAPHSLSAQCYGCENYQGQQFCNPFAPEFRFEECTVPPGSTCQLFHKCDDVVTYYDFNVQDRIGPGGNYLPTSENNVFKEGRLINACTGYAVAEQEFDAVPALIEI